MLEGLILGQTIAGILCKLPFLHDTVLHLAPQNAQNSFFFRARKQDTSSFNERLVVKHLHVTSIDPFPSS